MLKKITKKKNVEIIEYLFLIFGKLNLFFSFILVLKKKEIWIYLFKAFEIFSKLSPKLSKLSKDNTF